MEASLEALDFILAVGLLFAVSYALTDLLWSWIGWDR